VLPNANANDAVAAHVVRPRLPAHGLAWAFPVGYVLLWVLYGAVAWLSYGYDDEFSNILQVERHGFGVVALMQTQDVHPPGSYFINWLFHSVTGDWSLVRLATALLTVASLVYATEAIRQRHGERAAGLLFVLLCLNPAILMWCTGLRWYAYFVPVLIWLSITPRRDGWRYWAKCFGGLVVLGYIGYAVFVVALPVLLLYWAGSQQTVRQKLSGIFWGGLIGALLYAYQFHVFLTVHLLSKDSQVTSMASNFMGFAIAQVSNQGVFPISLPAVLSALGLAGMVIFAVQGNPANLRDRYLHAYGIGAVATIALGIAGKWRNLVIISPWQAMWLAALDVPSHRMRAFLWSFALLAVANLWGVYNVATHQDTTKNSWDLRIGPVLADLARERDACNDDLVIVAHDPALSWHVDHAGFVQLGPFSRQHLPAATLDAPHRCVVVVRSFAGHLGDDEYARMVTQLGTLGTAEGTPRQYGRDGFFRIKQRLDARYPEYQFEITTYRNVNSVAGLTAWQPLTP